VLNSCCCLPVAAGQVITRVRLNQCGRPQPASAAAVSSLAFRRLLYLALSFWIVRILFLLIIALLDPNMEETEEWTEPSWAYHILVFADNILAYIYLAFTVILLYNIRSQVRAKYSISEGDICPAGLEDVCCSMCCPCLVVAQMMRHTADYDTYSGRCCTETGLPGHVPSIV
jgi:Cys-rich protein (TIGR01571 family)